MVAHAPRLATIVDAGTVATAVRQTTIARYAAKARRLIPRVTAALWRSYVIHHARSVA